MKTTSLACKIGARSDVCRAPVVFLVLVAVFSLGSCGGKKDSDIPQPDADTMRRNPEVVDGTPTPDTLAPVDTLDAPDDGEVAADFRGQDKQVADTPDPDSEAAQPPALFPYKLAATHVLQLGDKKVTDPAAVSVGANGSLLCVVSRAPEDGRSILCFFLGDAGDEMIPVDISDLDEKLAELGKAEIVGLALPTLASRLYVTLDGGSKGKYLISAEFNQTQNSITNTTVNNMADPQKQVNNYTASIHSPLCTQYGTTIYTASTSAIYLISIQNGHAASTQRISLSNTPNSLQLTLNSSETFLVAASYDSTCSGEWWVFDRHPHDGTLALVTDYLVLDDCDIAIEGSFGPTLSPAPKTDHILFAGSDLVNQVALGIASLAPGTKQAVSLAVNLLPDYSPGTNSLATLPSHRLAALFLNTNYPIGAGLAIVQLNPEGTGSSETQFISGAELEEGVGVDTDALFCGLPMGPSIGHIQAFSQDGQRLFLGCSAWSEEQQELFGALVVLEANN